MNPPAMREAPNVCHAPVVAGAARPRRTQRISHDLMSGCSGKHHDKSLESDDRSLELDNLMISDILWMGQRNPINHQKFLVESLSQNHGRFTIKQLVQDFLTIHSKYGDCNRISHIWGLNMRIMRFKALWGFHGTSISPSKTGRV